MNPVERYEQHRSKHRAAVRLGAIVAWLAPAAAHASLFEGETLDAVANGAAWVVLVVGPLVGIAVFWIVHILPEKIAEKKHHPQAKAIQTLCLLSLFFGGLLWPLAWLWAMTKPVMHKMAYGTDKHHHDEEDEAVAIEPDPLVQQQLQQQQAELRYLREQLDRLTGAAPPTPEQLQDLRRRLAAIEAAAATQSLADTKG